MRLNDKLRGIGIRIADGAGTASLGDADLEDTLLDGVEALEGDGRLASLLLSWLEVHGEYVIVEKLEKLARRRTEREPQAMRWLPLLGAFMLDRGDRRFKKLARRSKRPLFLYPEAVTETAVKLKGATLWLKPVNMIVPADGIRIRKEDVLSPKELVRRHRQYRNRYLYGPTWRADIVTAIERGITKPADIARAVGCSYEPAHRISRQWRLVKGTG